VAKKMPKGKPFQKGQSGNPGGRTKLPDDIKQARKLNQIELERIVNRYLYLDRNELNERVKDPKTPMLEMMVASIIAQAAQKGDQQRLEFILSRLIGKVKDQLVVTTPEPYLVKDRDGKVLIEAGVKQPKEEP
jgi:hypothetical protein